MNCYKDRCDIIIVVHFGPDQEKENGSINNYYNEVIRYETLNTLLIRNFIDPPFGFEIFHEDMVKEISKINKDKITEEINYLIEKSGNNEKIIISVPIYRINSSINYKKLLLNYETLIN